MRKLSRHLMVAGTVVLLSIGVVQNVAGVCGIFGTCAAAEQKPLSVFILAGQSNMQGHAHVRTFEHIGMDPTDAPILQRDAA